MEYLVGVCFGFFIACYWGFSERKLRKLSQKMHEDTKGTLKWWQEYSAKIAKENTQLKNKLFGKWEKEK